MLYLSHVSKNKTFTATFKSLILRDSTEDKKSRVSVLDALLITVELQSLEHLWDHENIFETGIVRASEY